MPRTISNTAPSGGTIIDLIPNNGTYSVKMLSEQVTTTAAANKALTTQIPANSLILAAQMNFDTAITLVTGTEVGLGITGDPDALLKSTTTVTKNTKVASSPVAATAFRTAATTLLVASTNGSGTAAGTLAGTISVQVVFLQMDPIADAA